MARPSKTRTICRMPRCASFTAKGMPVNGINLAVDEYETIRLMDYVGLTQEECAAQMEISRATVQSLYTQARGKIARFLVEGAYLEIGGGSYKLCGGGRCKGCGRLTKKGNHKGEDHMKIAVTYEQGQVFQHFGHTEKFKIYEVENNEIMSQEIKDTNGQGHGALAGFLKDEGIEVLICGGIGGGARNALAEAGIKLYPGAMGDADEQVKSLLSGTLSYDPDTMCNHHHHGEGHTCGEHGCH